ncbi:MAG: phosphopantetheine-binding protein [Bacilli bacterium]|jgi:acyl carrier protein|nr:phosphopantetheine-binding protein [Bacilli bacterium]
MDIYQKLGELLTKEFKRKKFDMSKITPETELSSLGLDSLDMAELIINIEEEFNLPETTQEEMMELKTVKDVKEFIEKKLSK